MLPLLQPRVIQHRATRPTAPAGRVSRGRLAALRSAIATWREQTHFRWELKRISKDNPHLIDDIGLTRRQVEEEIAKALERRLQMLNPAALVRRAVEDGWARITGRV